MTFLRGFADLMHNRDVNPLPEKMAPQCRKMLIEKQETADPSRFAFSLSSDQPVDEFYGRASLRHDSSSIRQDRLKTGLSLLFNHNDDQLMGISDKYEIRSGKLYVEGVWSRSELAQQRKLDYDDGILKYASVRYRAFKIVRDNQAAGTEVLDVTDWEPLEASLVSVPADGSVGVGRTSVRDEEFPVVIETRHLAAQTAAPAANSKVEVIRMAEDTQQQVDQGKIEIARRDRIMALAADKDFKQHCTLEEVKRSLESGQSAEAFTEALTRKIVAASDANKVGTAGGKVMEDAGKDAKQYSLARAIRAAINDAKPDSFSAEDASFERQISDEIRKRVKQPTANGMLIPNVTRTVTATATGTGLTPQTATIGTVTESQVIPMYRNKAKVLALGATRLGGLSGIIRLPRQTGAGTAQWLAETVTVTPSDISTDFVTLTPKRLSMQNVYTMELLAETAVDVEGLLAADRYRVLALAIDSAALLPGSGSTPNGLLGATGLATITTSGAALATGNALSYLDILKFESVVAAANADETTMSWLLTPEARGLLKGTPMFASGYAMPIWGDNSHGTDGTQTGPLGYRAAVTNQIPKNFGTNHNLHAVIFGDFSNILVADWGASELIVDPYTQAANGAYVVTERMLMDVEIRHIQPFVVSETVAVS